MRSAWVCTALPPEPASGSVIARRSRSTKKAVLSRRARSSLVEAMTDPGRPVRHRHRHRRRRRQHHPHRLPHSRRIVGEQGKGLALVLGRITVNRLLHCPAMLGLARLALHDSLGQAVVVEQRDGVAGNIGAQLAAKAPADGSAPGGFS